MEESTKAFDIDLLAIIEKKKELSVNLKYAEMTILAMYEELQIVRATEDPEDNLKQKVKKLGEAVQEACQLVAKKEHELVRRTKAVQRANDQLKTIQEMIENELADNKHSEYLLKVFMMRDAKAIANCVKSEKSIAESTTETEQSAVPAINVENLKTDLKAGVDDLKHPADMDHEALKLVMDYRAKRDQIEGSVKQEEANIVNLTRELSQAKVQRKLQRTLYKEAIETAQDFSVSLFVGGLHIHVHLFPFHVEWPLGLLETTTTPLSLSFSESKTVKVERNYHHCSALPRSAENNHGSNHGPNSATADSDTSRSSSCCSANSTTNIRFRS